MTIPDFNFLSRLVLNGVLNIIISSKYSILMGSFILLLMTAVFIYAFSI